MDNDNPNRIKHADMYARNEHTKLRRSGTEFTYLYNKHTVAGKTKGSVVVVQHFVDRAQLGSQIDVDCLGR